MTPRRLPFPADTIASRNALAWKAAAQPAPVGWTRKAFAVTLHMTCLGLFGLFVVWPVASPLASGELAREFKPVLDALATLQFVAAR